MSTMWAFIQNINHCVALCEMVNVQETFGIVGKAQNVRQLE